MDGCQSFILCSQLSTTTTTSSTVIIFSTNAVFGSFEALMQVVIMYFSVDMFVHCLNPHWIWSCLQQTIVLGSSALYSY